MPARAVEGGGGGASGRSDRAAPAVLEVGDGLGDAAGGGLDEDGGATTPVGAQPGHARQILPSGKVALVIAAMDAAIRSATAGAGLGRDVVSGRPPWDVLEATRPSPETSAVSGNLCLVLIV